VRRDAKLKRSSLSGAPDKAHVRRGFYDLAKSKAPIATETLKRIAALYEIEARIRGKSAADRLAVRQAESKPLVTELRSWFDAQLAKLPARGPLAEAIRYALNHWDGLQRFLDDGRIELDNNSVERAMRPVCLSRKNELRVCAARSRRRSPVGRTRWASEDQ
jgi:transposase